MSVEIQFPVEFVVQGTPVSLQAARAKSKEAWKQRVKEASYDALPEVHFSTEAPISVTLFYFPATEMQGDVDNIVKPVFGRVVEARLQRRQSSGTGLGSELRARPSLPIC
jgi:Holliday junction resolvase RusA-like endonuclease